MSVRSGWRVKIRRKWGPIESVNGEANLAVKVAKT